tara:strand:- start:3930 stop:4112 length:183 start_codon:yes stop_codon:yes gene_type:complete
MEKEKVNISTKIENQKIIKNQNMTCEKVLSMYLLCIKNSNDCEYMNYWVEKKCSVDKKFY